MAANRVGHLRAETLAQSLTTEALKEYCLVDDESESCDELEAVLSLPWYKRQSLLGSTAVDQILNRPVA